MDPAWPFAVLGSMPRRQLHVMINDYARQHETDEARIQVLEQDLATAQRSVQVKQFYLERGYADFQEALQTTAEREEEVALIEQENARLKAALNPGNMPPPQQPQSKRTSRRRRGRNLSSDSLGSRDVDSGFDHRLQEPQLLQRGEEKTAASTDLQKSNVQSKTDVLQKAREQGLHELRDRAAQLYGEPFADKFIDLVRHYLGSSQKASNTPSGKKTSSANRCLGEAVQMLQRLALCSPGTAVILLIIICFIVLAIATTAGAAVQVPLVSESAEQIAQKSPLA